MLAISLSEDAFTWLKKKNKDEKWAAIRIYSQEGEVSNLSRRFNEQFEDVLVSYFTDITKEVEQDGDLYEPFTQKNYDEITAFVEKNQHCDKVFIHCHAGVCRSAGVVVGLANQYDWITPQHGMDGKSAVYPYPNVVCWFRSN